MEPCTQPKGCSSPTWNQPPGASPNTCSTDALGTIRTTAPPPRGWLRIFTGWAAVVVTERVAVTEDAEERGGCCEVAAMLGTRGAGATGGDTACRARAASEGSGGRACGACDRPGLGPPPSKQRSTLST